MSKSAFEKEFGEEKKRKEYTFADGNEATVERERKRGKLAKTKGLNFDVARYLDLLKKKDCCKGGCVRKFGFDNTLSVRKECWEQSLTKQWTSVATVFEKCSHWGMRNEEPKVNI